MPRCGFPLWRPDVGSRCGIPLWFPVVVYGCWLPLWWSGRAGVWLRELKSRCHGARSRCGLPICCLAVVARCGPQRWFPHCGLWLWAPTVVVSPRECVAARTRNPLPSCSFPLWAPDGVSCSVLCADAAVSCCGLWLWSPAAVASLRECMAARTQHTFSRCGLPLWSLAVFSRCSFQL